MARWTRTLAAHGLLVFFCACSTGSSKSGSATTSDGGTSSGSTQSATGAQSAGGGQNANGVTVPVGTLPSSVTPFVGAVGGPNKAFTLVGRFDPSLPALPRFSLPNTKIGGTFTGDTLSLLLSGDGSDYLSVFIDNGPEHIVATSPNAVAMPYPVATGLGAGNHTAWVVKRTESYEKSQIDPNQRTGELSFAGFVLAPGAAMGPPPLVPHSHLIVALGDSGFTGYGAGQLITSSQNCVFSPNTQNALISVPAKLADLMGAELINVSGSGKGIASSAFDPGNDNDQLPAMWQMAVPYSITPAYSFDSLPVDAIIVDGGSDDLVGDYGAGTLPSMGNFITRYTDLLTNMRGHYANAVIVAIITPNAIAQDKAQLTQGINAAVAARVTAGDARVFAYDYFTNDPNQWVSYNDADASLNLGHGCQGHPSDAGAAFLAGRLATFIRSKQTTP